LQPDTQTTAYAQSSVSSDGNINPATSAVRWSRWFGHTEDENSGLWSSKLCCCWPISVEQFVAGAEGCITDYWTVHQPAKDWAVLTQLLRISAAVI